MRRIVAFFVRYPVWVTVLMFSMIGFGLISLAQIRYSFFPEIEPDTITIQVAYPGASPEEMAEGVVLKIEENLDGLQGIERVTSISRENSATLTIETTKGSDLDKVLNDVKNAVDRISSFPVGMEKPVIFEQQFRTRSLSIVLFGQADLYNLKYISERLRDDLLTAEEISQVSIDGLPELEFSIEVSENDLRRYGLSFSEITQAVQQTNINISGGKFDTEAEEILIRAWGRDYHAQQLLDIPIRGRERGDVVLLGDVARVHEQWADVPDRVYYNGQPAVILNLDQTEEEDILAIAERGYEIVDIFNAEHNSVTATVVDDRTIPLRQRVELLVKNGLIGLALIIIALGVFLRLRLSFWVAVSIPFSFAGMFIVAGFVGITINVISVFGMILVVGILVDDAIVVAENIYAHYERGSNAFKAAVDGTIEVLAPVTTSVLTTVVAFLPFFFLDAILGKFIWQMALVVIASLLFSLIEAFFVLPSHLAHSQALSSKARQGALRTWIERNIQYVVHRLYAPSLRLALKHRWITVVTPVAMVMVTVGLIGGGLIGVTFFPFVDADTVPVNLSLVSGRQEADTDSILVRIEKAVWEVNEEFREERPDGRDVIIGVERIIGSNDFGESGSHTGKLTVELLDAEIRNLPSYAISDRLRERVGPVPQAQNLAFGNIGRFGKPVSISLLGNNYDELNRARDLLMDELDDFSSLKDVTTSDVQGRRELNITLKPRAHALGLTLQDIAGQVRQGFFGQEVQRIQRGRDEIRVWVRYRPEDRSALGFLDQMRLRTPQGDEYPFSELAEYDIRRGVAQISRLDRRREIKVEANMTDPEGDLPPILENIRSDVLPRVLARVDGVVPSFEGQSRDQAKMVGSMQRAFPIALLGMFILVTLVFRSYAQTALIFSLIPIGVLGAVWGHGIQGLQVNMLSLIGIIALSGIIINDSIVLVDQVNRFLRGGDKVYDAVYKAGLARLRPILLTTATTSLGLAPLIIETSRQAQFLIPMAVSVAYGLVFGTFILLIILPAGFMVFSDLRIWAASIIRRGPVSREEVEPAVQEAKLPIVE